MSLKYKLRPEKSIERRPVLCICTIDKLLASTPPQK